MNPEIEEIISPPAQPIELSVLSAIEALLESEDDENTPELRDLREPEVGHPSRQTLVIRPDEQSDQILRNVTLEQFEVLGGVGSGTVGHKTETKPPLHQLGMSHDGTVRIGMQKFKDRDSLFGTSHNGSTGELPLGDPTFHGRSGGEFRFSNGTVTWNQPPDADAYFRVDDHYADAGYKNVKHFVFGNAAYAMSLAPPAPKTLGGIGSGIKGHTTDKATESDSDYDEGMEKDPNANLSPTETSIKEYCGMGYVPINGFLRGTPLTEIFPTSKFESGAWFTSPERAKELGDELINHISNLDNAIAFATPSTEPITVFRGIEADALNHLKVGDVFHDAGFSSTSSTLKAARSFGGDKRVITSILVPSGTKSIDVVDAMKNDPWRSEDRKNETERILARGSRFRVMAISPPRRLGRLDLPSNKTEQEMSLELLPL